MEIPNYGMRLSTLITGTSTLLFNRTFSRTIIAILFLAPIVVNTGIAEAGFGITPPYVNNHRLTRGTVFEQKITLVRSDPSEDLNAEITMNVPEIESWISVDRGTQFLLPKGTTQVPIIIRVKVPDDAPYKQFKGAIRIRTASAATSTGATGVTIALGAQVDVDVQVVDKIFDFDIRKIRISDLEEGRWKWGMYFPGMIRFFMTVENTGNTDFGPTRVHFDIYDSEMESLLESIDNTNKIEKLAPFSIREVIAELPTHLGPGRYKAKYTIFKNEDIASQNTIDVSISSIGSVAGYEGYGFWGLSTFDKLKVAAVIGIPILIIVCLLIVLIVKRKRNPAHVQQPYKIQ